jgi:group I intron endonuclease
MDKFYIYVLQNITNNKIYVGQAKNLKRRWKSHRDAANKGDTRPLYNSMRKHGFDNFEMNMIEEFDNLNDCNNAEEFWIQFFQSRNKEIGYNIAYGGNNKAHTPETKAKLSKIKTGTKASPETKKKMSDAHSGENNSMFGRNHSDEALEKMSQAKEGKYDGENNPFYGKTHSEETRKLLSETHIGLQAGENNPMFGKTHTEETRKFLSDINIDNTNSLGNILSEDTKKKISEALKGKKRKPFTEEHRRNMSESAKNRKRKDNVSN